MKKIATAVLVLWCVLVSAAFTPFFVPAVNVVSGETSSNITVPIIVNGIGFSMGGDASYSSLFGIGVSFTLAQMETPVSISGSIKNLKVLLNNNVDGGGSSSYTYTLYKNGSSTSLSCIVPWLSNQCFNTSDTVSVAAGDKIALKQNISGSPSAPTAKAYAITFTADNKGESIIGSSPSVSIPPSSTRYGSLNATYGLFTSTSNSNVKIPISGKIDRLYLGQYNLGSGQSVTATVFVNDSSSSLSCVITYPATSCFDSSNNLSITAGDKISVQLESTNTSTTFVNYSFRWKPSLGNEVPVSVNSTNFSNSSNSRTSPQSGYVGSLNPTFNSPVPIDFTWKKLSVELQAAPLLSKSWTYQSRINNSNGVMSCIISDSSTTCQDLTNSQSYTTSDTIALDILPQSTPTSTAQSIVGVFTVP